MVYPQSWPFTRETDQFHHVGFGSTSFSDTISVWFGNGIFFSTTGCTMSMELFLILIPSGKRLHNYIWKIHPFLMGKLTISTGPFSIANC